MEEKSVPFVHDPLGSAANLDPYGGSVPRAGGYQQPQTFQPPVSNLSPFGNSGGIPSTGAYADPFGVGGVPAPPDFGDSGFGDQQGDARSTAESVWTLALSEVTVNNDGSVAPLNLMEEVLLLKAGDQSKFSKHSPTMDRILAGAMILELLMLKKVSVDSEFSNEPARARLNIVDESPTQSKLVNSVIASMVKSQKKGGGGSLPIAKVMDTLAASGGREGMTMKMLWRLVQKKKLTFDPRMFGSDKYPVVHGAPDLAVLRDRVVGVMDGTGIRDRRDELVSFLYYLPKNAADKIFQGQTGPDTQQIYTCAKAIAWAVHNFTNNRSWM